MELFLFSSNCFGSLKHGYKFLSSLIISDISVTTVKPLYSRHHQDFKAVSVIYKCPLHRGSFQIGLFYFTNLL